MSRLPTDTGEGPNYVRGYEDASAACQAEIDKLKAQLGQAGKEIGDVAAQFTAAVQDKQVAEAKLATAVAHIVDLGGALNSCDSMRLWIGTEERLRAAATFISTIKDPT